MFSFHRESYTPLWYKCTLDQPDCVVRLEAELQAALSHDETLRNILFVCFSLIKSTGAAEDVFYRTKAHLQFVELQWVYSSGQIFASK